MVSKGGKDVLGNDLFLFKFIILLMIFLIGDIVFFIIFMEKLLILFVEV